MASFWANNSLFGGNNGRQQIQKSDLTELVEGVQGDLEKLLQLETPQEDPTNASVENGNEQEPTPYKLLCDDLATKLARLKTILYEEQNESDSNNSAASQSAEWLTEAFCAQPTLIPKLLNHISCLFMPLESRKNLAAVFNNLMIQNEVTNGSYQHGIGNGFAQYTYQYFDDILSPLLEGYNAGPDIALLCGSMLRSMLRHRALYVRLLSTESDGQLPSAAAKYFYPFLDVYVHRPNFDVASDALTTVREVLLTDRAVAAEFLERDYEVMFEKYNVALRSENYITRRMSLKLLVEILLDRSNFNVMMKYISSRENLQIVMVLLSDPSPNIQFEAFHVFKIFVANPNKPEAIEKVLKQNREKLVKYLQKFHVDREGDEQFKEEKGLIITTLNGLE